MTVRICSDSLSRNGCYVAYGELQDFILDLWLRAFIAQTMAQELAPDLVPVQVESV